MGTQTDFCNDAIIQIDVWKWPSEEKILLQLVYCLTWKCYIKTAGSPTFGTAPVCVHQMQVYVDIFAEVTIYL